MPRRPTRSRALLPTVLPSAAPGERSGTKPSAEESLGTSITCSTSGTNLSRILSTSTTESTVYGTRAWRSGRTGAESTICSTMCRGTRSCGLTPARRSGREPPSSGTLSLSSRLKYRVPGSWEVGALGTSPCTSSRTHPPALAVSYRCALWCWDSTRAMATLIHAYLRGKHGGAALSGGGHCLPPPASRSTSMSTAGVTEKATKKATFCEP